MKKLLFTISIFGLLLLNNCKVIDAIFIDVSGNVSDNGTPVEGAIVLLVDGTNLADGLSLSSITLTNSEGDYTIFKPKKGKYFVVAIEDNGNFKYDKGIDRIGFHGVNSSSLPIPDLEPNKITVGTMDLENINITELAALPI